MGRRRKAQRAAEDAVASNGRPATEPEHTRAAGRIPPLAIGTAACLALASLLWAARPGAAYPAGVLRDWVVGGTVVAAFAVVYGLASRPSARRLARQEKSWGARLLEAPSPVWFALIVAAAATALSFVFASYAFEHFPATADEMAQLWHARMLAHGRLALPPDPNPEFFAIDNVIDAGRWYSEYPVGGPAVLAIGVLLGVPWLINPLLAGIATAAMYRFARRAFGELEGRAIAALFATTPMILMMSGTYMNHVPVLCLATCALAALAEWEITSSRRRGLVFASLIGLATGWMATIRPLDAVIVATMIGIFLLHALHRRRERAFELGAVIGGGMIGVAPLLYANWATTGSPLRFGYEVLWGLGHRLGFHMDPTGTVHTLARGYGYAIMYLSELNFFAMFWPVPALLVAIAGLLAMRRATRWDVLLWGLFFAQVLAYAAYWHQGQFLGPRFLFTAMPTVVVLIARMPFLVGERFGAFWRRVAAAIVLTSIAAAWIAPWDHGVWGMARLNRNSRRLLKVNYAKVAADASLHNAIVFLREPFSTRVLHRLWAVGVPRSDAAALVRRSDACSLLTALRDAEGTGNYGSASAISERINRSAQPFVRGSANVRTSDAGLQISSTASLTDACRAELADDERLGGASFGPALPLEPIDANGRVDGGDVVYVADLGERNELLRARFGNRTWYRLSVARQDDRSFTPVLTKY